MRLIAVLPTVALGLALAAPAIAVADPSVGIGFSLVLHEGKPNVAFGAKLLSTDRPDHAAVSVGLDYRIGAGRWRPNVGLAYLRNKSYADVNLGLDPITGQTDFGLGLGGTSGVKLPF